MLPGEYAAVKDQVGPCGIQCGLCPLGNGTVGETAGNLSGFLRMYDVASWAGEMPGGADIDFKRFDENLKWVRQWLTCPGCLRGGGSPQCPIRLCSKEKGHPSCGSCSDLESCGKFDWLGEKGKMLKSGLAKGK